MEPLCLGKPGDCGRSGKDNQLFVEAVLWIARTGSPWRVPVGVFSGACSEVRSGKGLGRER
jgi:hypothetical protein